MEVLWSRPWNEDSKFSVRFEVAMAVVNEPVSECTIIFKYLFWTADRKDKRYYHDRFPNIPRLKEYFQRFPSAGALVGYGKMPPGNVFAFEGSLLLEWTDKVGQVSKEFTNVFAFTNFLKENPALAKCVKYDSRT